MNFDLGPNFKLIAVGGGAINAANYMIDNNVTGIEYIAVDTDERALSESKADIKIQLGIKLTAGLGAIKPEIGKRSVDECRDSIAKAIEGADMLLIIACMGGGTGTGATPVIAEMAKAAGIFAINIITKPFNYETKTRMDKALEGISNLRDNTDATIIIPNEKLLGAEDTLNQAMQAVDKTLCQVVRGLTDIMTTEGLINLDYNDLVYVFEQSGIAYLGIGQASG